MLEKPNLHDDTITACLREHYALPVISIEFLPLGNDASAWVYRVRGDQNDYFLKVKKGPVSDASLTIPRFLHTSTSEQVVAPLPTLDQALSQPIDDFTLILYPFIEGRMGMDQGMSDAQWIELGKTLKKIHLAALPPNILASVPRETFVPAWSQIVKQLQAEILSRDYDDPFERELAAFWRDRQDEIKTIVARCETLGLSLQDQTLEFVLCHSDIHTANVLLDQADRLHIVDWDAPLLAPKERDLMFMVGDKDESLFFTGYGKTLVNTMAIAYYRYEWVVQEIGDFGARVFHMHDVGAETKQDSVAGFRQLFGAGDVVEAAYQSDS